MTMAIHLQLYLQLYMNSLLHMHYYDRIPIFLALLRLHWTQFQITCDVWIILAIYMNWLLLFLFMFVFCLNALNGCSYMIIQCG